MKRILYILSSALIALVTLSCSKNDTGADVSGQWHLVDSGNLTTSEEIDVYLSFNSGTFTLYQKIGSILARYWYYEGTYTVSSDNVLTGRYSDGTRLGGTRGLGYTVSLAGDRLTLTALASGEVNVYAREEIPADVIDDAVPPVKSESISPAL